MKVCVTGKGGSGKSVVTSLLTRVLSQKGRQVLVIDADESNLGLVRMLGIDNAAPTLMAGLGGKAGVKARLNKAITLGASKADAKIFSEDTLKVTDIPAESVSGAGGIKLVQVGKIEKAMEGCACMMGILGREFLSKLELSHDEVVLVDMEAGVEHFGRGVESGADVVLVVVDPSFESVLMAEKIKGLVDQVDKRILVVLNKVPTDAVGVLEQELSERGLEVSATVEQDPQVFAACLSGKLVSSVSAERALGSLTEELL